MEVVHIVIARPRAIENCNLCDERCVSILLGAHASNALEHSVSLYPYECERVISQNK